MINPAKLDEAVALLNAASLALQASGIPDEDCYDLYTRIEDIISEIEVDTYHAWDCAGEEEEA
jgi:hypothetical protein